MSVKIRALSFAALTVLAFIAAMYVQTRQPHPALEPVAWCRIETMKCYDQLGSNR